MCQEVCMLGARHERRFRPTLPGRDYHAPDVFELERERIFFREWMYVARGGRGARARAIS